MILMDFSYFFLLFSGFLAWFEVLFCEFLRFQLLFPALFKLFGWVWGAVLEILGITAPQGPLAMLPILSANYISGRLHGLPWWPSGIYAWIFSGKKSLSASGESGCGYLES